MKVREMKHLIKQRIKSVRLDLDIASPYMDSKEVRELEALYESLHYKLWSIRKYK